MRTNKAYLEKIGGEWLDDFVYISKERLKALDFEIIPFDGDDMENTLMCYPLDISKDVIIGSVEATSVFFKACGIEVPKYLGYPEELSAYFNREIERTVIGELSKADFPCFIKPADGVKLFTGEVIKYIEQVYNIKDYYDVTVDTPILKSGVIEFVSEYRCFVHEEELKGIQFYAGDYKVFPNPLVIEDMIDIYTTANCAYTLDVGVTANGGTWLVEVNDMWAIGSYGMDARTYALMCVRRMREIGRQFHGETENLWKKLKNRYNE